MATGLKSIRWPIMRYVRSGVIMGDSSVETVVMVTERARSPLLINVITLEAVPPGQVPTSTTPTVRAGSRLKARESRYARKGMMAYWATAPKNTSRGRCRIRRKSFSSMVVPMPNIMIPSIMLKSENPANFPRTQVKAGGQVMPPIKNKMITTPKYLPISSQNFFMSPPFRYVP